MQRDLQAADKLFAEEVDAFIAAHWVPSADTARAGSKGWSDALIERGWSVPNWPREHGGPDWTATQKFIWEEACSRHGVVPEDVDSTEVVGPLIMRANHPALTENYLADIVNRQSRWCLAISELDLVDSERDSDLCQSVVKVLNPTANLSVGKRPGATQLVVSGIKIDVDMPDEANFACVFAQADSLNPEQACDYVFVVVDLNVQSSAATGPATTRVKSDSGRLAFFDAPIDAVLWRGDRVAALQLCEAMQSQRARAVSRPQLGMLTLLKQSNRTLADDDPLHLKTTAYEVELEAFNVLHMRYADALQRGLQAPFPADVLVLRGRVLRTKLGELLVESFGYYALPYPDQMGIHNEGSVGPQGAYLAANQLVGAGSSGQGAYTNEHAARQRITLFLDDEED